MKIASFKNHSEEVCIGVKVGDNIADLTAGLEKYLVEEAGTDPECAIDVASERMPTSMLDLIQREEEGQADLQLTVAYINKIAEKAKSLFSPSGEKIMYGFEEVTLLTPVPQMHGSVFNMEYNYPAYEKVYDTIPPDDGATAMFMMSPETITGPGADIKWPTTATELTSAVELGIIIGKTGKRIPQAKALDYVFGYTVVNDITGISILRGIGPGRDCLPKAFYFTRAMTMDTFQPVGPFIALKDEIPDPQDVGAELKVNGKVVSKGNTKDMRCSVARLIEFLSQDITLEAGDLISTGAIGTLELLPEAPVKVGDVIEAEIERIGVLRNSVVA
ncbi:MAG: fumarylacetoacetate hydrolase family protein [Dehalococcoidia bacterium]|nr:fumarylacetoacetate hydrolase family protein [Dehalococcoidia bacterium]